MWSAASDPISAAAIGRARSDVQAGPSAVARATAARRHGRAGRATAPNPSTISADHARDERDAVEFGRARPGGHEQPERGERLADLAVGPLSHATAAEGHEVDGQRGAGRVDERDRAGDVDPPAIRRRDDEPPRSRPRRGTTSRSEGEVRRRSPVADLPERARDETLDLPVDRAPRGGPG